MTANQHPYDVIIAGGGLAGQTLARQLWLTQPGLSIAIIDTEKRPLPEASFKVGEATSELGAHYLAVKLQLKNHLDQSQLPKCGLRFFFGDSQGPLHARPEYGPKMFPPIPSYQLDRGRLENHLQDLNAAAGITLFEGFSVQELHLSDSAGPHITVIHDKITGATQTLPSTWLVDCAGRQRLIQKQLGLSRPSPLRHSACWFRVAGKCDVAQLVPASETGWHARVPGGARYNSTNHLMGHGYWVWLIPLASGNTSIGIVVDECLHPMATLDNYDKAVAWLTAHEPILARHLATFSVMDFKWFKEFSYDTVQFYSRHRWACVGEAATFLDPFYSPGSDFIGIGNTAVTQMITRHFQGTLTDAMVARYDATLLLLHRAFTEVFRDLYPIYGKSKVMTAKVIWDNASYWVFVCQMFFQNILMQDDDLDRYGKLFEQFYQLNLRVQQLFRDWGRQTRDQLGYEVLGYVDFPIAVRSHLELGTKKSPKHFLDWLSFNLDQFNAWAIVLYHLAISDIAPAAAQKLKIEHLSVEKIDLNNIPATPQPASSYRHPLTREIAAMRRQMAPLFPDSTALKPESSGTTSPAC